MNFIKGQELIQIFEDFSPKSYAVEGDKIGLQIGTLQKEIKKVMVTLDVLEEVVDEAIEKRVDLIIAHHPIIFRPLKNVNTDEPHGRMIQKLLKHDIAVYVAHTNLDVAKGGVNDLMAMALGLTDIEVLSPTYQDSLRKLVVFVPESHAEMVRNALGESGAGHIGLYSHCSFTSSGEGRFIPLEGTSPFIGENGKMETVNEVKIETIFPVSKEKQVLEALKKAHPYEEPAIDIYPILQKGESLGLGRVGILENEMTLEQFATLVKEAFDVKGVRVVGSKSAIVKKVAVLGGDGNKYIHDAKRSGADVYVTGDVYYHVAHDAMAMDLHVVDPGHNVEKVMKSGVQAILTEELLKRKMDTEIIISKVNTDPFTFM